MYTTEFNDKLVANYNTCDGHAIIFLTESRSILGGEKEGVLKFPCIDVPTTTIKLQARSLTRNSTGSILLRSVLTT